LKFYLAAFASIQSKRT